MKRQLFIAAIAAAFGCATAQAARAPAATTATAATGALDRSYPAASSAGRRQRLEPAQVARTRLARQRSARGGHASEFDARLGRPSFLWAPAGLQASAPLALARRGLLEAAGRDALNQQALALGLGADEVAAAGFVQTHDLARGALVAGFQQRLGGYEVFNRRLSVAMTREFKVVATAGYFAPVPEARRGELADPVFARSPQQAAADAFADLGGHIDARQLAEFGSASGDAGDYRRFLPQVSGDYHLIGEVRTKPVLFPLADDLVAAFYVELQASVIDGHRNDFYAYVIAADDGRVLFRHNLTRNDAYGYRVMADASGRLAPYDNPLGNGLLPVPQGFTPSSPQPPRVAATPSLVTLTASPQISTGDPWLPAGATVTTGNNVDAYLDLAPPDGYQADRGDLRPVATTAGVFDYPVAVDTDPTTAAARNAAGVNLFYLNNWLHDFWYDRGFAEVDGNAQTSNYGRGGVENDAIQAQGQDYSGTNNANMSTPADGGSPRMQMYLFSGIFSGALTVTSPASLGNLSVAPASFGPQTFDLTQALVGYTDNDDTGVDGVPGTFTDACSAATNAAALAGKIALIDRGSCDFTVKVSNAQAAGAVGVVIADNQPGEAPFTMGGTPDPRITTPAMMTSYEDGQKLRTALAGPVSLRMLRNATTPLDGTTDNGVIAHEFFHYVSNRLVGNGSGLSNNQGGGMGEGWSDVDALLLNVREEDRAVAGNDRFQAPYSTGFYVLNDEYFGIRRAPYSTDFAVNPLTFKYIEDGVALPDTAPFAFGQDGADNAEVHNAGEVWAVTLWDVYAALLNDSRHSFAQARQLMQEYVVAGLKLTPNAPTFTEARDGILAAVLAGGDTTDFDEINAAFARRGLGLYAISPPRDSTDNAGVSESFAVAPVPTQTATARFDMSVQDADGAYCDTDNSLDAGETGLLTVRVPIAGDSTLAAGIAATASEVDGLAALSFAGEGKLQLAPDGTGYLQGSVRVSLAAGGGDPYGVRIQVQLANGAVVAFTGTDPSGDTLAPYFATLVNYDLQPKARSSDGVEQAPASLADWTPTLTGVTPPWRIADFDDAFGTGNAWWAPSSASPGENLLTSLPIVVGSGAFTLSFQHYFAYSGASTDARPSGKSGGVLEVSVDGGAWRNVTTYGSFGSGGYNGTLTTLVPSAPGWVGSNGTLSPVTVNFGTSLANSTIRLRFHQYSNYPASNVGWVVDDLAVNAAAGTPFTQQNPENGVCVNRPPYADAGADFAVVTLQADGVTPTVATLPGSATDLDGTSGLSYAWTQTAGPAVTLSSASVAQPTFAVPKVDVATPLGFSLTVSDGIATSSDAITVTATPGNRPPVANAGADVVAATDSTVTLDGSASGDPDNDLKTYAWAQVNGPTVSLTAADTARPSFTAGAGIYAFRLTVGDAGGRQGSDLVVVTLESPPTALVGPDQTVDKGASVTLDGSGSSDSDGSITSYVWTQTAGPAVTLTANAPQVSFTAGSPGTYVFTLTVTDNAGLQSTATTTVTAKSSGGGALGGGTLAGLIGAIAWRRRRRRAGARSPD